MNTNERIAFLEKEVARLKAENADLKNQMSKMYLKSGRNKSITEDTENKVIELRILGNSMKTISKIVNISVGSVHAICKRHDINKI